MTIYIVNAYRWGHRDNHSYTVGARTDLEAAKELAAQHVEYRGGKYGCEVLECDLDDRGVDEPPEQVHYVESPYYGAAGRHQPSGHPADANKIPDPGRHLVCSNCFAELPERDRDFFTEDKPCNKN